MEQLRLTSLQYWLENYVQSNFKIYIPSYSATKHNTLRPLSIENEL
jgi:hypothetical protein